MAIDTDKVVKVSVSVSTATVSQSGFGILTILTDDMSLPAGDPIRSYSGINAVGNDMSGTSSPWKSASLVFQQNPQLTAVLIARWFEAQVAASAGFLSGGTGLDTLANLKLVLAGGFSITMAGQQYLVNNMDFSGAADLAAIGVIIDTRISTLLPTAGCIFANGIFTLTSGLNSDISVAADIAPGTLATQLALTTAKGALAVQGHAAIAAETITQALSRVAASSFAFAGVQLALAAEPTDAQILETAAWAEANNRIYDQTSSEAGLFLASSTTDIGSQLKALGYNNTLLQAEILPNAFSSGSAISRLFATDFMGTKTMPTLKFKVLPGVVPLNITETQRLALLAKNVNYYTKVGATAMFAEGMMVNGRFADEVYGLQWLASFVQDGTFAYLQSRPNKVAQTDRDIAALVGVIKKLMSQAVVNGLLAPGVWNGDPLGTVKTGDTLLDGFYVFASSVDGQPQLQRQARDAPPITIIATGAGAIHFVSIALSFQP